MKRPGPVGLTLFGAFALVAAIETRTLLAMVGIEVSTTVYYPVAIGVAALAVAALYLLPAGEGDPGNGDGGPPEGNPDRA